ncbi:MAG TPA: hypothetical protein VLT79_07480 [Gemmatimonadales bacterium]|nr:hypothetical protein [Gemmatimonadales bacterium]
MRASTARLTNSSIRLSELAFPAADRLIQRTRLAFIHIDNLLAFAKRDRDGRVDGYLAAYLPEECLLVFLRRGEAANAASLTANGREVITITDALDRMKAELDRGELIYCTAPLEQLAWMYQSCAGHLEPLPVEAGDPVALLSRLAQGGANGILELIADGRVSYLRFERGRPTGGYFTDKPDSVPPVKFVESEIRGRTGRPPALSAVMFRPVADLPTQASRSLIATYREVYWRFVDAVEKEFPNDARRRAQKVGAGIEDIHKAIRLLAAPRGTEPPDIVVQAEELASALADWTLQLLEGVEVVMPGTAPGILKDATREHRYVLQSAGFYTRLPWQIAW